MERRRSIKGGGGGISIPFAASNHTLGKPYSNKHRDRMIILLLLCCSFSVGVIYHCLITDNVDWTCMAVCVCLCVCAVCCSLNVFTPFPFSSAQ